MKEEEFYQRIKEATGRDYYAPGYLSFGFILGTRSPITISKGHASAGMFEGFTVWKHNNLNGEEPTKPSVQKTITATDQEEIMKEIIDFFNES